ncbi:MAG: SDR family oxidoreductase [Chloroflexota bacterium]
MAEGTEGRVALVTGAGSGVGRASALALARAGLAVGLVGRRQEALEESAAAIHAAAPKARLAVTAGDVSIPQDVARIKADVEERLGSIDILVNNAGVNVPARSLKELAWADWQRIIDVNLHGCYLCAQAVLPGMRERGGGTLIHVGSYAALRPGVVAGAAYTAAKAGLAGLSGVINAEEGRHGIRSTVITLGEANTPILDLRPHPPPMPARLYAVQPEDVAACIELIVRLPARVTIEDIVVAPTRRA